MGIKNAKRLDINPMGSKIEVGKKEIDELVLPKLDERKLKSELISKKQLINFININVLMKFYLLQGKMKDR